MRTAEDKPSGPPRDVRFVNATATSLRLQWTLPFESQRHGNITSFVVSYHRSSSMDRFFANQSDPGHSITSTTLSIVVDELEPYMPYIVSVCKKAGSIFFRWLTQVLWGA